MLISSAFRAALRKAFGPPPPDLPDHLAAGLVLAADGIGGLDLSATALRYEVARAGLRYRVETISWCHGFGHWYRDLTHRDNIRRHAQALAQRIRDFRSQPPPPDPPPHDPLPQPTNPSSLTPPPAPPDTPAPSPPPTPRPVFLVGKSGGCGVLIDALEQLPSDSVERAVFIAPAVSARYDLRRALQAVHREIVIYWSPLDLILLGLGTSLLGTVDRVRTVGAGLTGFRPPPNLDPAGHALYAAKLRQVRWTWRMIRTGYCGGHIGPDSPWFLRRFVLPLLTPGPSQATAASGR
ncbi:MAG: hypothetical protein KatS3mg108_0301 [Isosphaeraceae bacterium]|jgi:hypothetical protein|nr:MAG: hypothetical protein KatS3mg108_0301 [Isosphaeraceae bacterium]